MIQLPEEFLNRVRTFAGKEYELFVESLSTPPPISVRLNPLKQSGRFDQEEIIPWSLNGRYLSERPSFTFDPLFHAGCYYVQEASSQFLEQPFLEVKKILNRPLRILDLCAAPGGKSTHILSMIGEEDFLVSNELIGSRNNILRQNIMKWGRSNAIVTQNDPSDFSRLNNYFDVIIIDAPCSGEGLFRKDEDAIGEWSVENVNRCSVRQKEILNHAYNSLSNDGFIIYSTCTYEEAENDMQVERLITESGMEIFPIENNFSGILKTKFGLAFFPHRIRGEGFYISLLRKKSNGNFYSKKSNIKSEKAASKYLQTYLSNADKFIAFQKDDRLFSIPTIHAGTFSTLNEQLYIRHAGIYMGELKGNDFIPSESLALSNDINPTLPKQEVDHDEAIKYLRGETIKAEGEKGWKLIAHQNFNLGWIKNLGGRTNNYYPKEWRIKKLAN